MNHASNMTNVDSAGSETPAELRTLYLAGGCFWGLEAYLKRLPGVRGTVVGYANGSTENPSYYDVCRWNTGHAETVAVTYDPRVLPTDVLQARPSSRPMRSANASALRTSIWQ